MTRRITRIGLISDTHGLLREEALHALRDSELVIHAGDIGNPGILTRLEAVASVVAVKGNVDTGEWAAALPETAIVRAGSTNIYVLHDVNQTPLNPAAAGFSVVVSGHSHKPARIERSGVLYINPGSAGPRRFKLPVTIALLQRHGSAWQARFFDLLTEKELAG